MKRGDALGSHDHAGRLHRVLRLDRGRGARHRNQFRLILHTAAYWLLLDLRDCAPSWNPVRQSEFATIRLRLLKVAGRITETASRIRVSLASCCPEAELFSLVTFELQKAGP